MLRDTQRKTGAKCSDCGPTVGVPVETAQGGLRCDECGRFSEEYAGFCAKHEVHWGGVTGYDHCPMCREEQRVRQARQEQMARRADPNMHPTVDARRR